MVKLWGHIFTKASLDVFCVKFMRPRIEHYNYLCLICSKITFNQRLEELRQDLLSRQYPPKIVDVLHGPLILGKQVDDSVTG